MVKLYHGDFHDFDIKADVLITEPLFLGSAPHTIDNAPEKLNPSGAKTYNDYIKDIIKTTKCPVMVFLQPSWRELPEIFNDWVVSELYTHNRKEFVVSNRGAEKVYTCNSKDKKINPRSYELMREIVEDFSEDGDIVYDPFMGYGSTGTACEGREFIGVEIDDNFFSIAERNLKGVVA